MVTAGVDMLVHVDVVGAHAQFGFKSGSAQGHAAVSSWRYGGVNEPPSGQRPQASRPESQQAGTFCSGLLAFSPAGFRPFTRGTTGGNWPWFVSPRRCCQGAA